MDEIDAIRGQLTLQPIGDLGAVFSSDDNWFEADGKMIMNGGEGQMMSMAEAISEAWYKHDKGRSAQSDFIISGLVTVPKSWDSHQQKTITLLMDNVIIGSQKIDGTGAVDWHMSDQDEFVVGIMGFSEWVKIDSDLPTIDNVSIYK